MKNTTTAHRANRARKDPQIIDGCRRLSARRSEGQTFTVTEIAEECGVDDQLIAHIERRALEKIGFAILAASKAQRAIEEQNPARSRQRLVSSLKFLREFRGSPGARAGV